MHLTLFVTLFPELGWRETRTCQVKGYPGLPDEEYGLIEAYCTDPACDCRRVMLNVATRESIEECGAPYLASIGYGFDRDDPDAGPYLDPLNPQSEYAEALLEVVETLLQDGAYVARLETHYRMVKESASERPRRGRANAARTPANPAAPSQRATAGRASDAPQERVPKAMRARFEEIVAITDEVCRQRLNEEYAQLSRKAAAALARKRPSPLAGGQARVWACAIVYAIGSTNFLWDKSQTPHLRADELCALFGVAKSTGSGKAKAVTDSLSMSPWDWRWMLPSRIDDSPMVWMVSVDGLIIDVRRAPRAIQEEALRKGLIPWLPGTQWRGG